ncbi:MAG: hypothetical protein FWH55_13280, partial [Oscillospiraceae bacterium]|nr:hypothetical protein [Oscillospiraceae bacterium]
MDTTTGNIYTKIEIDQTTLGILEFNKIKDMLIDRCVSPMGKQIAEELAPSVIEQKIVEDLRQTSEAESFIIRNSAPAFGNIRDIRDSLKRAELGAVLSPAELLSISDILRSVKNLRKYSTAAATTATAPISDTAVSNAATTAAVPTTAAAPTTAVAP